MAGKRTSIRRKIISVVSLLIIGIMFFVGLFTNYMVHAQLVKEISDKGKMLAKNIAANSHEALLIRDELSIAVYLDKIKEDKSIIYGMILDGHGKTIAHTDLSVPKGFFYDDMVSLKAYHWDLQEPFVQWSKSREYGRFIDISVPMYSGNSKIGIVRLGFSGSVITKATRRLTMVISAIAFVGILFGVLITDILVSRITRPIKSLTRGARIIGSGNLDYEIKSESTDEIGQLASAFNEMTTKLKVAQKDIIEKEKMKQELQIAREIQQSLLPAKSPEIEDFELESIYRSAKEIGGDYYDFLEMPSNRLGIVIADVSGKGVPGSLGMAITRSIFRTQVESGGTAGEILSRTNELVFKEIKRGIFVSMFFSILDIEKRELNCASAGHNPPVLIRNGSSEWLELGGIALGVDKGTLFNKTMNEKILKLSPGDIVVHYTDGVTEAKNGNDEEFGEDKLKSLCDGAEGHSAKSFNEMLISILDKFADGASQSDDITVVTLKVK